MKDKYSKHTTTAAAAVKKGQGIKLKSFVKLMEVSSNQSFTKQRLHKDVSIVVAKHLAAAAKMQSLRRVQVFYQALQSNPFGEFVAMVDVMMEAMMLFAGILADQTRLMTEIFESLVSMSAKESEMAGSVVAMGGDVAAMGGYMQEADTLMEELNACL